MLRNIPFIKPMAPTLAKDTAGRTSFFSSLYMLVALMLAQQIVVRASGMKYSEFLGNVRRTFRGRQ